MNQSEFVYFIQEKDSDYFKIGITTTTIKTRLSGLQSATPHELIARYVVGPLYNGNGISLERSLHKQLADKRVRGEWFRLPELNANDDSGIKNLVLGAGFVPGDYKNARIETPTDDTMRKSGYSLPYVNNPELAYRLSVVAKLAKRTVAQLVQFAVTDWLAIHEQKTFQELDELATSHK